MFSRARTLAFVLAALTIQSSALIYDSVSDLPSLNGYDYIIVGGGTAGGVLGNRLSEDKNSKVLVIEGGPTNRDRPEVTIPYLIRQALGEPALDWNTTYIPQAGLLNRTIGFTRGYILGGSSSINGMVYSRGTKEDFDRYAAVTKDQGWSWDSLQKYFLKNEKFIPAIGPVSNTGHYDPKVHGKSGIVGTSVNAWPMDTDSIMMQVTKENPEEYPFTLDFNSGVSKGVGWAQYTIGNGTRSSSAWTYLGDSYINRPNLFVLTDATVKRVLPSKKGGAIDTVEFVESQGNGTTYNAKVNKEIVLSAGLVGSPYILLHSGIGDARTLRSLNISVVADIPSVGQNLTEQALTPFTRWLTRSNDTFQHILENATLTQEAYAQWNASHTGPFAAGGINQFVWLRMNESDPEVKAMIEKYGDPAAGPDSPHYEITPSNGRPGSPPLMDLSPIGLNPYSRGSLTLNASNPTGQPLLDGAFFKHPMDLFVQKQALKAAINLVAQPAWKDYVTGPGPEFAPVFTANGTVDDAQLELFIRNQTVSNIHGVGTASMSPCGAPWGVVDPDLKVKGLKGLRVVDASVLPFVVAGHVQVPIYVAAERAADLMKKGSVCGK
ncbi:alcohol oxidase [Dentipellis sp. KUC8613]|nr:alcohol oxidase [Dentipellis sp. KUC8613]